MEDGMQKLGTCTHDCEILLYLVPYSRGEY